MIFTKRTRNPTPLSKVYVITMTALVIAGTASFIPLASYILTLFQPFKYDWNLAYKVFKFKDQYSSQINSDLVSSVFFAAVMPIAAILSVFAMGDLIRNVDYNNARFARIREIRKAGLYKKKGLILGYHKGRMLRTDGPAPASLIAPTRSGKGVSFVMPNLLACSENMVVLDMKRELYNATSGRREKVFKHKIVKFDPWTEDGLTDGLNPLDFVPWGQRDESLHLNSIAGILVQGSPGSDPVWADTARELFVGLAHMMHELEPSIKWPVSLGQMYKLLLGSSEGLAAKHMILCLTNLSDVSDMTRARLSPLRGSATKMIDSYITTLRSSLSLFENPYIDEATSVTTFDVRDLRKKKMTIYICTPPDEYLRQISPTIRYILSSLSLFLTRHLPEDDPEYRYPTYIMADELPAWGKIPSIIEGVGFISGYGLRLISVFQSPNQLSNEKLYSESDARSFLDNQATKIVFGTNEAREAKEISDKIGTVVVHKTSRTNSNKGFFSGSNNTSEQTEALLKPQNIVELGDQYALVFERNLRPLMLERIYWYKDKNFKNLPMGKAEIPHLEGVKKSGYISEYFSFLQTDEGMMAVPNEKAFATADLSRIAAALVNTIRNS